MGYLLTFYYAQFRKNDLALKGLFVYSGFAFLLYGNVEGRYK